MGYQILDAAHAIAAARAAGDLDADADLGRMRNRLAILTWLGGLGLGLVAGLATGRLVVLVVVLSMTLVATLLVGLGPLRILARIKKRTQAS